MRTIAALTGGGSLMPFGWAPGTYIGHKCECGREFGQADKNAYRCQECASRLRDETMTRRAEPVALDMNTKARVLRELHEAMRERTDSPELLAIIDQYARSGDDDKAMAMLLAFNNPTQGTR